MQDAGLLAKYRQRLLRETEFVNLPGMLFPREQAAGLTPVKLPLNQMYIRLQALQEELGRVPDDPDTPVENYPHESSAGDARLTDILTTLSQSGEELYRRGIAYRALERPEPLEPENALQQYRRLLILGTPGSGKTTLLQYLARNAAENPEAPAPVLLSLKDYALHLSGEGRESLREFALNQAAGGDPALRQALATAKSFLWLLDDLDAAARFQRSIVRQLNQLAGDLVLTGRPRGYQKIELETCAHFEILPMTPEAVDAFLHDWFFWRSRRLRTDSEWVEERTRWIQAELMRRPQLQALAGNPLLLTCLVSLFGEERAPEFPERRVVFYGEWIKTLAALRTKTPVLENLTVPPTGEMILEALAYLGWYINRNYCERQSAPFVAVETLREALTQELGERWGASPQDWPSVAAVLLAFWQQVGILETRTIADQTYWGFRHSVFREYAAAQKLAEIWQTDLPSAWKFLAPRFHHPAWREPILLLAALLPPEALNTLVSRLLRGVSPYERALQRDLRLCVSFLSARLSCAQALTTQIIRRLSRLSGESRQARLGTLILTYGCGALGIGVAFLAEQFPFSWPVLLMTEVFWAVVWLAAFNKYEIPVLQQMLGFPLRVWQDWPDWNLAVRLCGHSERPEVIPDLLRAAQHRQEDVRRFAFEALGQVADGASISALMHGLTDPGENVRRAAALALAKLGAIPRLVEALNENAVEVRNAAGDALVRVSKSQAAPNLTLMLQDSKDYVRKAAVETLRQIGGNQTIPALVQALHDSQKEVRLIAAEALGEISHLEKIYSRLQAVPELVQRLQDSERQVRRAAAYALGQISDPGVVPALIQAVRANKDYVQRTVVDALQQVVNVQSILYLLQAVHDDDPDVRMVAAELFGRIGAHEKTHFRLQIVPVLIEFLLDRDSRVRRNAAEALGRIEMPEAVEPLLALCSDPEWTVRWAAAEALGKIGVPQAVPVLLELLQDSDSYVCRAAIEALGRIGGAAAIPDLIRALKDDRRDIQDAAEAALNVIGEAQTAPYLIQALRDEQDVVSKNAEDALRRIGHAPAVPYLIQALQDADEDVRRASVVALGRIGEMVAVPHLIGLLHDPNEKIRSVVAEALGIIGEITAVTPLIQALGDSSSKVRIIAAKALGRLGAAEAVTPLSNLLQDANFNVRRAGVEALGRIVQPDAVPVLVKAMADESWWVRWSAAYALGRLGDAQTAPHLMQALKDSSGGVRRAAAEALGQIGGKEATPPLLEALADPEWWVRWAASVALGQIGAAPAAAHLLKRLADEHEKVRWAAAEALGKIGGVEVVPALIHALKDTSLDVRKAAGRALSQIKAVAAIPYLIQAMQGGPGYVYRTAWQALRQIDDARAIPYLIDALREPQPEIRQVAAEMLVRIGDAQAASRLIPVLVHGNWEIRQSAADILGQLAYTVTDRKILRRLARALWWRLTDHPAVAKAAWHALDLVANRLAVLEVEMQPMSALPQK